MWVVMNWPSHRSVVRPAKCSGFAVGADFGGGELFAAAALVPAGQEPTPSVFVFVDAADVFGVGEEAGNVVVGEEPADSLRLGGELSHGDTDRAGCAVAGPVEYEHE